MDQAARVAPTVVLVIIGVLLLVGAFFMFPFVLMAVGLLDVAG